MQFKSIKNPFLSITDVNKSYIVAVSVFGSIVR